MRWMQVGCNMVHSVLLMETWEVGFQDSESPLTTLMAKCGFHILANLVYGCVWLESAVMCVFLTAGHSVNG